MSTTELTMLAFFCGWGKDVHSFARRKKDKRADPWEQQTVFPI